MSNKQRLTVYSFRLEVVHAMRTAYRRAMARQRLLPRSSLSSRKLGRPIPSAFAPLRCADYHTEAPSRRPQALKPRNERSA
jgi:hypothetical protein